MPVRQTILANGEYYHVFNRSLFREEIFSSVYLKNLFIKSVKFYLQLDPPVKFSVYRRQAQKYQIDLTDSLADIISFCIMPTHYHFLLMQKVSNGITKFISKVCNSYSHFYNLKKLRKGPLYEGKFKAVRVKGLEQLLHLNRYIHLNPVTDHLVENPENYEFSSYNIYLGKRPKDFVKPEVVLNEFSSVKSYQKFVMDRKNYQRELAQIKHLILEESF